MKKNTKKRSRSQIQRDRRRISDMYLRGVLQVDIAEELGLSQPTISNDLASLHKEWLKTAVANFDSIKANELAKIDRLEREYWTAWERSQEDAETSKQVGVVVNGKLKDGRAEKTKKGQSGNPSFLTGVQWCIEQRLKIFGIYEAIKIREVSWQDDIVQMLISGDISPADVKLAYPDLALDFFKRANVTAD